MRISRIFPVWTLIKNCVSGEHQSKEDGSYIPFPPERLYKVDSEDPDIVAKDAKLDKETRSKKDDALLNDLASLPHKSFWMEDTLGGVLMGRCRDENGEPVPDTLYISYFDIRADNAELVTVTLIIRPHNVSVHQKMISMVIGDGTTELDKAYIRHALKEKKHKTFNFGGKTVHICISNRSGTDAHMKTTAKSLLSVIRGVAEIAVNYIKVIELALDHGHPVPVASRSVLSTDNLYSEYKGDVEVVRRIWASSGEYNRASPEQRQIISSRKRDHGVRGHWRTYKSGKRIWISDHRRGDASLGTVTSHIQIMK